MLRCMWTVFYIHVYSFLFVFMYFIQMPNLSANEKHDSRLPRHSYWQKDKSLLCHFQSFTAVYPLLNWTITRIDGSLVVVSGVIRSKKLRVSHNNSYQRSFLCRILSFYLLRLFCFPSLHQCLMNETFDVISIENFRWMRHCVNRSCIVGLFYNLEIAGLSLS